METSCVVCRQAIDSEHSETVIVPPEWGGGFVHTDPCWKALIPFMRKMVDLARKQVTESVGGEGYAGDSYRNEIS